MRIAFNINLNHKLILKTEAYKLRVYNFFKQLNGLNDKKIFFATNISPPLHLLQMSQMSKQDKCSKYEPSPSSHSLFAHLLFVFLVSLTQIIYK